MKAGFTGATRRGVATRTTAGRATATARVARRRAVLNMAMELWGWEEVLVVEVGLRSDVTVRKEAMLSVTLFAMGLPVRRRERFEAACCYATPMYAPHPVNPPLSHQHTQPTAHSRIPPEAPGPHIRVRASSSTPSRKCNKMCHRFGRRLMMAHRGLRDSLPLVLVTG